MTDYDVIIIGAGPAGSSCAKHLVENGIKTLIVEKRKLPRYKACGGILSPRSIEFINNNFGNIPKDIILNPELLKIKLSKTGKAFFHTTKEDYLNIKRDQFDFWLVNETKSEILENSFFINHKQENDNIKVTIKKDNSYVNLTCKYLVGADGGGSFVRKSIDNNFKNRKHQFYQQLVFKGSLNMDKNYLYYLFDEKYSDFCSCLFEKNDLSYIGFLFNHANKKTNFYNNLVNKLKDLYNIRIEEIVRKETCIIDISLKELDFLYGKNNVLLAGESTGLLTKLGEGISSALISGKYVSESIIESNTNKINVLDSYKNKILPEEEFIRSTQK